MDEETIRKAVFCFSIFDNSSLLCSTLLYSILDARVNKRTSRRIDQIFICAYRVGDRDSPLGGRSDCARARDDGTSDGNCSCDDDERLKREKRSK